MHCRVTEVMSYHPVTIVRSTPLAAVEALLQEHDFDALPVTEDGALLGIVTRIDVLRAFLDAPGATPAFADVMRLPAERVMTRPPITVGPEASLASVLQVMAETRSHSVPVVMGALLIGIVSRRDVMRRLAGAATTRASPRGRSPSTTAPRA